MHPWVIYANEVSRDRERRQNQFPFDEERWLLAHADSLGTPRSWHVRRRAFPFQPTMNSGFPHGRDAWISAAATSWAVMALSLPESKDVVAQAR